VDDSSLELAKDMGYGDAIYPIEFSASFVELVDVGYQRIPTLHEFGITVQV
jgi:hypothetical protein